jgi:hypothetical protein
VILSPGAPAVQSSVDDLNVLDGATGGSAEQLFHLLRGPGDDRAVAPDDDRPLHQARVREQYLHHRLPRGVVAGVEAQLLEVLVLPDQLGGLDGEQVEEVLQILLAQRVVQELDDVELDAAFAQDVQRATRLASTGVVVDDHTVHGYLQDAEPG